MGFGTLGLGVRSRHPPPGSTCGGFHRVGRGDDDDDDDDDDDNGHDDDDDDDDDNDDGDGILVFAI